VARGATWATDESASAVGLTDGPLVEAGYHSRLQFSRQSPPLSGVFLMAGFASRLNPWGLPMLFAARFMSLVSRDPLEAMNPVWPTARSAQGRGAPVTRHRPETRRSGPHMTSSRPR